MPDKFITANLREVIAKKSQPGVTVWNRLEGRPRADKFDRALRAEVRDPLWLLTRQWQLGEFRGDDAGSPIFTKVRLETTRLRKYQAAGGAGGTVRRHHPAGGAGRADADSLRARRAGNVARPPAVAGTAVAQNGACAGARRGRSIHQRVSDSRARSHDHGGCAGLRASGSVGQLCRGGRPAHGRREILFSPETKRHATTRPTGSPRSLA